jgi:hypothetical protein
MAWRFFSRSPAVANVGLRPIFGSGLRACLVNGTVISLRTEPNAP